MNRTIASHRLRNAAAGVAEREHSRGRLQGELHRSRAYESRSGRSEGAQGHMRVACSSIRLTCCCHAAACGCSDLSLRLDSTSMRSRHQRVGLVAYTMLKMRRSVSKLQALRLSQKKLFKFRFVSLYSEDCWCLDSHLPSVQPVKSWTRGLMDVPHFSHGRICLGKCQHLCSTMGSW